MAVAIGRSWLLPCWLQGELGLGEKEGHGPHGGLQLRILTVPYGQCVGPAPKVGSVGLVSQMCHGGWMDGWMDAFVVPWISCGAVHTRCSTEVVRVNINNVPRFSGFLTELHQSEWLSNTSRCFCVGDGLCVSKRVGWGCHQSAIPGTLLV